MKTFKLALVISAIATLAACVPEKVSPDRLEEARSTAKANSEYNAQLYRAANPRFTGDYSLVTRSDTSQTAECPQGDGWAAVSIMKVDGKVVDKTSLVCSTYSASVGCYRAEDFAKDAQLTSEDNHCRREVQYPLPVLKK